jgi:hypothetical protein
MVEAGLKAAGCNADPQVHEAFTKYRKWHNDGVFDAYVRLVVPARNVSSPAYGVTLRTMKSRTSMEVHQSPRRKPRQLS